MKQLLILRSASGAGKSTFADFIKKGWWNPHDVSICCADDYFTKDGEYKFDPTKLKDAHSACKSIFSSSIEAEVPVIIVANTNTNEWEFSYYENIAKEYNYNIFHIVLENRHGNNDVHGVPDEVKERQKENLRKSLTI